MATDKLTITCCFIMGTFVLYASSPTIAASEEFKFFERSERTLARLSSVSQAAGLKTWARSTILRAAPRVNKRSLLESNLPPGGGRSCTNDPFTDTSGVRCSWLWNSFTQSDEPLPTELPADMKSRILSRLSEEKRNDPEFLDQYLKRELQGYQKRKMYKLVGNMKLDLCVAPDSQTAQEFLIYSRSMSTMPTNTISAFFSAERRLKGLGTIAFLEASDRPKSYRLIMFVRDNIAVVINAHGTFANEGLSLAQKLDALIQKQPALSRQQFLARRPSISIAPEADKTLADDDQWVVSCNVSAPQGQEVIDLKVHVDGQMSWIEDGKIYITGKPRMAKVKLTAITSDLLSNTFQTEVVVPE